MPKNKQTQRTHSRTALAVFGAALCLPTTLVYAASSDDTAALIKAIERLQAENRDLARRLSALEGEKSTRRPPVSLPDPVPPVAQQTPARETRPIPAAPPERDLERRVADLEVAKTAQEDSVRNIIRDSLSKTGSRINEFVSLGGAIEVQAGRGSDFSGQNRESVQLSTAELDLDIKANDWMSGSFIIQYDTGSNVLFSPTQTFTGNVDRLTVDRAAVTIGDVQRFPFFAKVGRDVLSFGTSTGIHRADVLSFENPLTIEVFETRRNSVGIGFAFPTPAAGPPPPGVIVPPVRPLVVNPAFDFLSRRLGYQPSILRPKSPTPTPFVPEPPPFYGSIDVYDANTVDGVNRKFSNSFNGRLGYQTRGHCGRPYEDLKYSFICPWAVDVSIDYISSIFDSRFLENEYRPFINQIGQAPGIAADLKMSLGPILLIAEYNTAIKAAKFNDVNGDPVKISPAAWQVALGYQFDWNPWVETIGGQGTFVAVGYSRSHDLAGVPAGPASQRVGFVPESRLNITAAEWVLDGAKIGIEYSHNWDYARGKGGGTGREADGILLGFTYTW